MLLTLKVLNSDATLNNFMDIGAAKAIRGSDLKIVMQLIQVEKGIRYIPAVGATVDFTLKNSDNTTIVKSATFPFAEDRSIIQIELTDTETALLISQNLVGKLTEGTDISYALLQLGLQMVSLTQGC